ncbi:MAG: hypothetical protein WCA22_15730 [Candidatus Binatus sp.]
MAYKASSLIVLYPPAAAASSRCIAGSSLLASNTGEADGRTAGTERIDKCLLNSRVEVRATVLPATANHAAADSKPETNHARADRCSSQRLKNE